jgi:4-hydroxy-tetrahydrodipicolinate synthase
VAPYYNKPTQSGMIAHFEAVAAAVPEAPIMLYNVPGRTGSNVSSATTLHLARSCPNVVAVKEASGDLSQIMTILRDRPIGFRVFAGDDAITLPLVALGADGVVSVAANEAPDLMNRLTEAALSGDFELARSIHYRLLALMDANFIESNPGPVKAVMAHQGLLVEHLRLPLVPVSESTRARLHDVVDAL